MTTKSAAAQEAASNGKTQPPARQELYVLQQTERGFRAIQQEAVDELKRLKRYELPLDMEPKAREAAKDALDNAFDTLADIILIAADHREIVIQRAAKNSKATNDALATAQAELDRRESAKLRRAAK